LVTEVDDIYRGISRFNKAQVPDRQRPGPPMLLKQGDVIAIEVDGSDG